jgi:outer membrane protein assembly factor BamB
MLRTFFRIEMARAPVVLSIGVAVACALIAGCQPVLDQGHQAEVLPPLTLDPQEEIVDQSNWPGWRGLRSSGISAAVNVPVTWTTSQGVRWRVEVPGEGNSSPVVWEDSILFTTSVSEEEGTRILLLCFGRKEGSLKWKTELGLTAASTHPKNGYASASVTTNGEAIFTFAGFVGLYCHDMAGNQRWHVPLQELEHRWGTAASPVLYRNLVIQLCDYSGDSFLTALDQQTGSTVWRTRRDSHGGWSTPVVVRAKHDGGERDELIVNGTGTSDAGGGFVIAYDPVSGEEFWRLQGTTDTVCPTIMVGGGMVYSTSGRNGPIIAIRLGGTGDMTGEHVWKIRRGGAYVPTGVVYRNRVYTINDGGTLACHNAGSGELIWRERLDGNYTASLIAAAGRIYATSQFGAIHVVAANDEFEHLATNEMNDDCLATPAISRGEMFIRTTGHLYCIAAKDPVAKADVEPTDEPNPASTSSSPSPSDGQRATLVDAP